MSTRIQRFFKQASALLGGLLFSMSSFAAGGDVTFGLLLVGPHNDHGWSQAHYEGGHYVEKNLPGSKMIYIDKVNPADRPGVTIPMVVDDLVDKGANVIIGNSDDMKDGIREAAAQHPDVKFIHISALVGTNICFKLCRAGPQGDSSPTNLEEYS